MLATEPHRKRPHRSQRPSATHNKRRWLICLVGSGLFFTCSLQFIFVHVLTKSHATTSGLEWWIENRTQILDESSNGDALNSNRNITLDQDPLQWLLSSSSSLASLLRSTPSLFLLMQQVLQHHDDTLKPQVQICQQFPDLFGTNLRTTQRRIFVGGLIADDSWHVLGTAALEARDLYHAIVLVESNRTQSFHPRPLRFTEGSEQRQLLLNHLYGKSLVHLVEFVNEDQSLQALRREHHMRAIILQEWKALGMQPQDIGLILDPDEIISRDFLKALAWCETTGPIFKESPAWRGQLQKETCRSPNVKLFMPMWEGSPHCLVYSPNFQDGLLHWQRPSMIVGACIEGIGKPTPPWKGRNKRGHRLRGYGDHFDYSKIPNGINGTGQYPRYDAADFRHLRSENLVYGGVGYHLHNFFNSEAEIRFKYGYFGHAHKGAVGENAIPLGALNADMNLLVRCARGSDDSTSRKQRHPLGLAALNYTLPRAFAIPGYIQNRHQELQEIVRADEAYYGRADGFDGNHLYNETNMLTHKGKLHLQP